MLYNLTEMSTNIGPKKGYRKRTTATATAATGLLE